MGVMCFQSGICGHHREVKRRLGWTLVESLVVVAVLAVLLALMLPAYNRIVAHSKNLQCLNNLRQIGMALLQHQQDHDGWLPTPGLGRLAWNQSLRPYNIIPRDKSLFCPADPQADNSFIETGYSYSMNDQLKSPGMEIVVDGKSDYAPIRASAVTFPARTIFMGDSNTKKSGRFLSYNSFHGERHGGISNFVFCDGHVEGLKRAQTITPVNLWIYNK